MNKDDVALLRKLVESVGLSGYNDKSARLFLDEANKLNLLCDIDILGSVAAKIPASKDRINHYQIKNVMVCAHQDVIGFMVYDFHGKNIAEIVSGSPIDIQDAKGLVETRDGTTYPVRIFSQEFPPDEEEGGEDMCNCFLELEDKSLKAEDILTKGDLVYYRPYIKESPRGKITGTFLDNKIGNSVCLRVMKNLVKKNSYIHDNLFFVLTTFEETTGFGAKAAAEKINPLYAINIDLFPYDTKKNLGKGPVITLGFTFNRYLNDFAIKIAEELNIPYQLGVYPGWASCDCDHITPTNGGTPCIDISIPVCNLHTPEEMSSKKDIDNAVKLVTAFCERLSEIGSLRLEV